MATYTAKYTTGEVIYQNQKPGNLWGQLPLGAFPIKEYEGKISTLYIEGIEDEWQEAFFKMPSGQVIIVKRD